MGKNKLSKELMEMRKQEKIYFSIKDYDKAEQTRRKANKLEMMERSAIDS